jgi:hypothetical protein
MLVHQSNRSCNCCGKSVDNNIIDISFEEIKLSPFAVECDCGYFYEAIHYSVSFNKWRVAKRTLEYKLDDARSDCNREKEFLNSINNDSDYHLIELERLKKKIIELYAKWDEISLTPVPDHLWIDKDA